MKVDKIVVPVGEVVANKLRHIMSETYAVTLPHDTENVYIVHEDISILYTLYYVTGQESMKSVTVVFGMVAGELPRRNRRLDVVAITSEEFFLFALKGYAGLDDLFDKNDEGDRFVKNVRCSEYECRFIHKTTSLSQEQVEKNKVGRRQRRMSMYGCRWEMKAGRYAGWNNA